VLVFVEDAAESVTSSDVESVKPGGFGDRWAKRSQGCRGAERAVRAVAVVDGCVVAERV